MRGLAIALMWTACAAETAPEELPGEVSRLVDPCNPVVVAEVRYDAFGNVVSGLDGSGAVRRFASWDSSHLYVESARVGKMNADGSCAAGASCLTSSVEVDKGSGLAMRSTDARGQTRRVRYDGLGRVVGRYSPVDGDDASEEVAAYVLPSGGSYGYIESVMKVDGAGRRSRARSYVDGLGRARGSVSEVEGRYTVSGWVDFDVLGRPSVVVGAFETSSLGMPASRPDLCARATDGSCVGWSRYRYEDGRVSGVEGTGEEAPGPATVSSSSHVGAGWVEQTDARGTVTRSYVNALGQPVRTEHNTSGDDRQRTWVEALIEYDGLGQPRRLTERPVRSTDQVARTIVTESYYDARGLLRGQNTADEEVTLLRNGYEQWVDYDEFGNSTHQWHGSRVGRTQYDALMRPLVLEYSDDGGSSWRADGQFIYDTDEGFSDPGQLLRVRSCGRLGVSGERCSIQNGELKTESGRAVISSRFRYNALAEPTEEVVDYRAMGLLSYTMGAQYARNGHLDAAQAPNGTWMHYGQDAGGRPTTVRHGPQALIARVQYDIESRPTAVTYGNGLETTSGFDVLGRLKTTTVPGVGVSSYRYTDGDGLIDTMVEAGHDHHYRYDTLGRLIYSTGRGATVSTRWALRYQYDHSGNLLTVSNDTSATPAPTYSESSAFSYQHGSNRYQEDDGRHLFQYNDFGELLSTHLDVRDTAVARRFDYDSFGRVQTIRQVNRSGARETELSRTEVAYDALGRKIARVGPNGTETYVYDLGGNAHIRSVTTWTTHLPALATITTRDGGQTDYRFIHTDSLGSTRATSNLAAQLAHQEDYLPFGRPLTTTSNRYRYTGQEYEPLGNLHEDQGLYDYGARYYDPLLRRFISADTFLGDGNRFAYALNNPIAFVDPTGHQAVRHDQFVKVDVNWIVDRSDADEPFAVEAAPSSPRGGRASSTPSLVSNPQTPSYEDESTRIAFQVPAGPSQTAQTQSQTYSVAIGTVSVLQRLWTQTVAETIPREQGGKFVQRADGSVEFRETRARGTPSSVRLEVPVEEGERALARVHTHPMAPSNGMSFSEGDIMNLAVGQERASILQTGSSVYLLVKGTRVRTPTGQADRDRLACSIDDTYDRAFDNAILRGVGFQGAVRAAVTHTANRYGYTYYEGTYASDGSLRLQRINDL